jgi:hypothetical protein
MVCRAGKVNTLEAVAEKSNALFALFCLRPGKGHHFFSDRIGKGMLRRADNGFSPVDKQG